MFLTRRALFLLLLTAVLLALATVEPVFVYLALGYLLVVLGMTVADLVLSPARQDIQLSRENDARLSLGAPNRVLVRVMNRGKRAVQAIARDEYPSEFRSDRIILDSLLPDEKPGRVLGGPPGAGEIPEHLHPPPPGDYNLGALQF
jgi:uncharacterized protein (DUF58 family)